MKYLQVENRCSALLKTLLVLSTLALGSTHVAAERLKDIADIAGVLSENRRVLGMMPHPERAVDAGHGATDGQALFRGLLSELTAA